jgi:drug/metabolite transporter (DMT)-like permease
MAIGRINLVAPIVAAHPVFIVVFAIVSGTAPSATQLAAVVLVLIGVGVISATGRRDAHGSVGARKTAPVRKVVTISLAASLLYAGAIIAVQQAVQSVAELPLLWLGRTFGLIAIVAVLLVQRQSPLPPSRNWWPFFLAHGILDSAGLLFILLGSTGGPEDVITAVVASTFPIVTVLLAWAILKERMTLLQTIGAAKIFAGVAILAATGHT